MLSYTKYTHTQKKKCTKRKGKKEKKHLTTVHVHRPSINTLTSLTEKLSRQNAPDLMNNNSNNIRARAASSGLTTLQQYRWIYWWLTKCIQRYGPLIILGFIWLNRPVLRKICAKNDFYIFVPNDLNFWCLDLKFAPVVTLVQRSVSTKLEVSTAFLFRENRRHGTDGQSNRHTDGRVQHLMQPTRGLHNNERTCFDELARSK